MTDEQLWEKVGARLAARRVAMGWTTPAALKRSRREAPNERTIIAIESGYPGHVRSFADYCAVLDMRIDDVLREVLPADTLSGEAMRIGTLYDRATPRTRQIVQLLLGEVAVRKPDVLDRE